jgi:hypothetical protein
MIDLTPLTPLVAWQQEKPETRSLDIKFSRREKDGFSIFAFDSSMLCGQFVKTINDLDLEKEYEVKQRAEYERLKAKFEPSEGAEANE